MNANIIDINECAGYYAHHADHLIVEEKYEKALCQKGIKNKTCENFIKNKEKLRKYRKYMSELKSKERRASRKKSRFYDKHNLVTNNKQKKIQESIEAFYSEEYQKSLLTEFEYWDYLDYLMLLNYCKKLHYQK